MLNEECASHKFSTHHIRTLKSRRSLLVHLLDQFVDQVFSVAQVTALDEVLELPLVEAARWAVELEGPQEVRSLLEVGADSEDLVDEILHTDHAVLAKVLLDDFVVGKRQTLLVNLTIPALYNRVSVGQSSCVARQLTVDEFADGLLVGVSVSDEWLNDLQHLQGGLGEPDEDTVVNLQQAQQLEGLALLGIDLVDALYPNDESELCLGRDVEAVRLLGLARQPYPLLLGIAVFLHILLRPRENDLSLLLALICLMLAPFNSCRCATGIERGNCIIPERWLTIRQH